MMDVKLQPPFMICNDIVTPLTLPLPPTGVHREELLAMVPCVPELPTWTKRPRFEAYAETAPKEVAVRSGGMKVREAISRYERASMDVPNSEVSDADALRKFKTELKREVGEGRNGEEIAWPDMQERFMGHTRDFGGGKLVLFEKLKKH